MWSAFANRHPLSISRSGPAQFQHGQGWWVYQTNQRSKGGALLVGLLDQATPSRAPHTPGFGPLRRGPVGKPGCSCLDSVQPAHTHSMARSFNHVAGLRRISGWRWFYQCCTRGPGRVLARFQTHLLPSLQNSRLVSASGGPHRHPRLRVRVTSAYRRNHWQHPKDLWVALVLSVPHQRARTSARQGP